MYFAVTGLIAGTPYFFYKTHNMLLFHYVYFLFQKKTYKFIIIICKYDSCMLRLPMGKDEGHHFSQVRREGGRNLRGGVGVSDCARYPRWAVARALTGQRAYHRVRFCRGEGCL